MVELEPEDLVDDYWPFESRKPTVKNMWDALKDVNNTSMMGVSGMGGVGKNTFVKEVGRQAMEDLFVDEVVFAEVTETLGMKGIQTDLADKLAVERFKKGKKILLILDNTWEDLDLKTVGIPSGAWSLFAQTAGDVIKSLGLNILHDVCKKCGGLPIAIAIVARALKNKTYWFE